MGAELESRHVSVLIGERDWSQTSLGPRNRWPAWLSTVVSTCLRSEFPVALVIGPDYRLLYNDRYAELIGSKHPGAFGRSIRCVFPESWGAIGSMLDSVMAGDGPVWREDYPLFVNRGTGTEECRFTFSFSAITDERGGVGGILCICTETTARTVTERRMQSLYDLASELTRAKTSDEVWQSCQHVLTRNPFDLPFAVLYEQDPQSTVLRNVMVGIECDDPELWLSGSGAAGLVDGWRKISGLNARLKRLGLTGRESGNADVDEAFVLTSSSERGRPGLVLVAGVNPLRPFDMEYLSFLRLILGQIIGALGSVRAYEHERRRAAELEAFEQEKSRHTESLRRVLDSLPGSIETFDRDWNYTYANDSALNCFKMSREEVIGRNLWRDWPYFSRGALYEASMRAVAEERPVTVEWFSDHSQRWLETRISPGPTMISMSTVRIDDRKEAEKIIQLRVREQAAIAQIGHLALVEPDIELVMRAAVELVTATLDLPRAAIVEIQRDRRGLLVRVEHGFSDALTGQRIKNRESLSGYTLEIGKPVVVRDLAREARFSSSSLVTWGVASGISVIIAGPDHTPYGVLMALATEPREFPTSYVPFLEAIANVLGAAIQRRHVEEALARERAYLEMRVRDRTTGLRQANQRLRGLSKRLLQIQEQERRHIARELHDEIGQTLTILKMDLRGFEASAADDTVRARLQEGLSRLDDLLTQIRGMTLDLGPSMLDDLGLVAALRSYARRIAERAGLQLTFDVEGHERRLPGHVETAGFRIGQEAITNVVRHARARRLVIAVRFDRGTLLVTVRDDGRGFDATRVLNSAEDAASAGLFGMQERASLAGGSLDICSQTGLGTTVSARFPTDGASSLRRRQAG